MSARRPPRVAVIGPSQVTAEQSASTEQVGLEIAQRGAVLVGGGLSGVKWAGGTTVIATGSAVDAVTKALGSLRP